MVQGNLYNCRNGIPCNSCPNKTTCIFWQVDPLMDDAGLKYVISRIQDSKGNGLILIEAR